MEVGLLFLFGAFLCTVGFKEREKWIGKFVPDRKYIFIRTFLKPIIKSFTADFRNENMESFKEV